uniref:Putative secreted protein n=1 Tax=Ixodes ricinus TaxID=34613 RepID=A0A147BM33_IXORI
MRFVTYFLAAVRFPISGVIALVSVFSTSRNVISVVAGRRRFLLRVISERVCSHKHTCSRKVTTVSRRGPPGFRTFSCLGFCRTHAAEIRDA